jgi:hypothetical protein
MNPPNSRQWLFAAAAILALASPAAASDGAPLFGGYWSQFVNHWTGYFGKQNGVIMFALGLGAVSLFIITRGKWKK